MLSVSKAQQGAQVNTGPCRKEGGEEHHILADYMKNRFLELSRLDDGALDLISIGSPIAPPEIIQQIRK